MSETIRELLDQVETIIDTNILRNLEFNEDCQIGSCQTGFPLKAAWLQVCLLCDTSAPCCDPHKRALQSAAERPMTWFTCAACRKHRADLNAIVLFVPIGRP